MIKPGIWRTRGGVFVAVHKKVEYGYVGPNGQSVWRGWSGQCLDCGAKFTWDENGAYSPVTRHDLDITGKSSAHGRVSSRCMKSHFPAVDKAVKCGKR